MSIIRCAKPSPVVPFPGINAVACSSGTQHTLKGGHQTGFRLLRAAQALLLLAVLALGVSLEAQETRILTPEQAGGRLAVILGDLQPLANTEWHGTLKIRRADFTLTIPVLGQAVTNGPKNWRMIYTTSAVEDQGAEQLTVLHTTDGTNQYWYARAPRADAPLGKPKPLSAAAAEIPLAGSDFWLTDLGFEFYHWPVQRELKGEMRRGRPCHVLESVNPQARPGGYARVKSWVDRETGGPIEAEAYDRDDRLLKEFSLGSFKKVNGQWELKQMEINNRQTDSRTRLEFDLER